MTAASGSASIGNGRMSLETIALLRATPSTERPTIVAPLFANSSYWRAHLTSCPLKHGPQSHRRNGTTPDTPRVYTRHHAHPLVSPCVQPPSSASVCLS